MYRYILLIKVTYAIFKRGQHTYNKRVFLFKIEDVRAAYFRTKFIFAFFSIFFRFKINQ